MTQNRAYLEAEKQGHDVASLMSQECGHTCSLCGVELISICEDLMYEHDVRVCKKKEESDE